MDIKLVWDLLFMFGGVAVMMIGMRIMGNALEMIAGGGMKKMLGKVTNNRFAGIGIGLGVTSIIQSSTATTVMLVGFVNIGLLTLMQATNVIMGANIGTTVTAHIVSLSGVFDIGAIAAFIGLVGVMMSMLSKNKTVINVGNILAGFGLIFIGLEFISTYATKIMFIGGDKTKPQAFVQTVFQGDHFPLLLILIGIVITALVHSSSTITSLMVVLCSIDVLTFDNALFLALGSNIGTCITSIMSSVGTNTNAKRTAVIHLSFNTVGCLIFLAPLWIFKQHVVSLFASISGDVGQQLAIFHTLFNVATTLLLLPFVNILVKLICKIIPDKKDGKEDDVMQLDFIDDRLLNTPPIAVSYTKQEIIKMGSIAKENINLATDMLFDSKVDNNAIIRKNEEKLNFLNKAITAYLTKLINKDLSEIDDKKIGSYYHVVSDLERVGDYAENILEYSLRLRQENVDFSDEARAELTNLVNKINELYDKTILAFDNRDTTLIPAVKDIEEEIDDIAVSLEGRHIERVKKGACTAQLGSIYLQTVSNLERVADHITNVALSIKQYKAQKEN